MAVLDSPGTNPEDVSESVPLLEGMEHGSERDVADPTAVDGVVRLEWDMEYPPEHVAAYLIDGPEPILVDAGPPGEEGRAQLERGLAARGYEPADVAHVVITHPHTDHTGLVADLVGDGARLYAADMAIEQLGRDPDDLAGAVRETAREVGVPEKALDTYVEGAVVSLERNRELLSPDAVDVTYAVDGAFDVAGYRFESIHVPGHQRAQTCFAVELDGRQVLFAGDGLIEPFRPAALHAGLAEEAFEAVEAFYAGLDRLADRDVDRVLPGHGPTFGAHQRVIGETRNRLDELVDEVDEALGSLGEASANEVAIERRGIPRHPGPLLDVVGALGYMEREGRVTSEWNGDGPRSFRPVDG